MEERTYPVQLSIDYPDRPLDRVSTGLRIFYAIPILILAATVSGSGGFHYAREAGNSAAIGGGGFLFLGPALMILFRQKYPRWWFDWNLQFARFTTRVSAYLALMTDQYPSTDEEQTTHVDFPYPDVARDLDRWMPLVKWFLAIPHFIVLFFLFIAVVVTVIISWFAILFTGRYPRGLFDFAEGVFRWATRVIGYAGLMVTDVYPPFRLSP
jgi:Domain of unknown function (DUF4389)